MRKKNTGIDNLSIRRLMLLSGICVSLSVFLAYFNALNGPWALDDIVVNRTVNFQDISQMMGYRSISLLSFKANQMFGGLSPIGFRIVNIVIHMINSILVLFLAYLSLKNSPSGKTHALGISLLSAIFFALHPLNINAVTYIVQRMASLATMFVLLSLIAYRSAVLSAKVSHKFAGYCLCILFIILGILSKENAIIAPVLILIYDYFFLSSDNQNQKKFWKRAIAVVLILTFIISVSLFILRFEKQLMTILYLFTKGFNTPVGDYPWVATDVYWTPKEHILTELRVLCRYLILVFFPIPDLLVFDYWSYPVSKGLFSPPATFISAMVVLGLLVFSVIYRKRFPYLSFGILWYFTAIFIESFIAVGADLYFEHRNYLPLTGFSIGVMAFIGERLLKKTTFLKIAAIVVSIGVILGSLTYIRNLTYRDSITLWSDTLKKAPSNLRAMVALGNAYLSRGHFSEAKKYFNKAITEGAKKRSVHYFTSAAFTAGIIELYNGNTSSAERILALMDKILQRNVYYYTLKGFYLMETGQLEEARNSLKRALNMQARDIEKTVILVLLGDVSSRQGNYTRAEFFYKKALEINPRVVSAYYGLAQLRLKQKRLSEAESLLKKAKEIDNKHPLVLADLADLLLLQGRAEEALSLAQQAILYTPPFKSPYLTMGNIYVYLGDERKAYEYYKMAVDRGASKKTVLLGMARSYYLKGNREKAEKLLRQLKDEDTSDNK